MDSYAYVPEIEARFLIDAGSLKSKINSDLDFFIKTALTLSHHDYLTNIPNFKFQHKQHFLH